jgi:Tyrosine phosphatase family
MANKCRRKSTYGKNRYRNNSTRMNKSRRGYKSNGSNKRRNFGINANSIENYHNLCDETMYKIRKDIRDNVIEDFSIIKYETIFNPSFKLKILSRFPNAPKEYHIKSKSGTDYTVPDHKIHRKNSRYVNLGTSSEEKVVNFYRCNNNGIITYRFGTKITKDPSKGFNGTDLQEFKQILMGLPENTSKKKILCISLLTPCNSTLCGTATKEVIKGVAPKLKIFYTEDNVLKNELSLTDKDIVVISIPLSVNKKFNMGIFDYEKIKEESMSPSTGMYYSMIDINTPKKTFRSIVDFAEYFYDNLKDTHILMYHCKSGKDRTSVFDAVVQSTIYFRIKNGYTDYEKIKILSSKMLVFGLLIAYYGTGNIGLKLNTIPLAKYILTKDELVNYKGDSNEFESSG